ncbi:hypothetical protein SAMN05660748_2052 [Blastococcus aggregatus]|uniref:Uncharacterized protein n=1 Tax=Blastococcus aggregatus TaxID=38502 RepID=A0A285V9Z6_9ACTN|nr:hypothetical protein [Blastococcus aggregatus]SOC49331.1 hypothetical protein SAMN05660748_2052 [Blastococcus aggregatus]
MDHEALRRVADLLDERNRVDGEIAALIQRPMTSGHLGEWIAAEIFDIALEKSATSAALDGYFRSGPLQHRSVNVKWYLQREGIVDLTSPTVPDDYLVMTGPTSAATSSHGRKRPWRIDSVYLFDATQLRDDLVARGRKVGTASSVRAELWAQAEIYPEPANSRWVLTEDQVEALRLFTPAAKRPPVP